MVKKIALLGLLGLLNCNSCSLNSQLPEEQKLVTRIDTEYTPKVISALIYLYSHRTNEFPLCALGRKVNGNYIVDDLRIPFIMTSTDSSAAFMLDNCGEKKYLGMIHNHSKTLPCGPSNIDLQRFIRDKNAKLEIVVCSDTINKQMDVSTSYKELMPKELIEAIKRWTP